MENKNWTKEEDEILKKYYTEYGIEKCLSQLNRTKGSIQIRRKRLGIETTFNIKLKYHKEELEPIVKISFSYKECLSKLEINNYGASYNTLKKYIKKYNIDISHFKTNQEILVNFNINEKINLKDILVENSTYSRTHLKERLYKEGLKERKCELCGQGEEWNGNHMSLILDHINGINNDNRIKNLRIVCPNCNATLDTHCRGNNRLKTIKEKEENKHINYNNCNKTDVQINKNIKSRKVERPPLEQLLIEVKELGYRGTGKKYDVSDNSIRKWIKNYEKNNF